MPCGLSDEELNLLYYLYAKRCLSDKHSKSVEAIYRDLGDKLDVDEVLQKLLNARLIGRKKKKKYNYWAQAGAAKRILRDHGFPISKGGRVPI